MPAGLDEVVEQLHVEFIVLNDEHSLGHWGSIRRKVGRSGRKC
jgi:hypothetical protein